MNRLRPFARILAAILVARGNLAAQLFIVLTP